MNTVFFSLPLSSEELVALRVGRGLRTSRSGVDFVFKRRYQVQHGSSGTPRPTFRTVFERSHFSRPEQ